MNLKKLLLSIKEEANKPSREANKSKINSELMMAVAMLQNDETKCPASLFNIFDDDMRKAAMVVLLTLFAQAINE